MPLTDDQLATIVRLGDTPLDLSVRATAQRTDHLAKGLAEERDPALDVAVGDGVDGEAVDAEGEALGEVSPTSSGSPWGTSARMRRASSAPIDDDVHAPAARKASSSATASSWVGAMQALPCSDTVISDRSRPSASQCAASTSSLRGISVGAADEVGLVGVLGDEAQRLLLAAAADHDRDPSRSAAAS